MEIIIGALVTGIVIVVAVLIALRVKQGQEDDEKTSAKSLPAATSAGARAGAQAKKMNWLVGESGAGRGKTYHIGTRDVTIGRKVGNYIQLTEESVSRTHLKVHGTTAGVIIEDMGSEGGTFVNDQKLSPGSPYTLKDGDKVRLGETTLVFHKEGSFGTNHGLTEQKIAGTIQHKKTAAMGVVDWKAEVQAKLEEAGGDVTEAARKMDMPEDAFRKLMEKAGVTAD